MHSPGAQFGTPAFAAPGLLPGPRQGRRGACARRIPRATAAPEQAKRVAQKTALKPRTAPAVRAPPPAPPIVDGPYAQACIALLRRALRSRTGNRSLRPGYAGLVEECRQLLARRGPEEQQAVVEGLLRAAVIEPVGVAMFRKFFSHRPAFNADLTPLCFSWLVGKSERNLPPEGGEGVYIEKCRFLEEAACKGLCVNMCQQPVQNLFTKTLGLPLRMTPNYDDNSCQMTFGVAPLPVHEDPAASGDCLVNCKMSQAFRQSHSAAKCYIENN